MTIGHIDGKHAEMIETPISIIDQKISIVRCPIPSATANGSDEGSVSPRSMELIQLASFLLHDDDEPCYACCNNPVIINL